MVVKKIVRKELGKKITFGIYAIALTRDCQITYYKNGDAVKAKDVDKTYDNYSLYAHALEVAKSNGFKESDLKRG